MNEDDRITSLPNSILCYILSFLPTKQVVTTSVLSKHWKPLWRSVSSLEFDSKDFNFDEIYFHRSIYSFLFLRDSDQPLNRLRIKCFPFKIYQDPPIDVQTLFETATRGSCRLEHLHINLDQTYHMPSVVFSCKTLVVLKLAYTTVKNISFVDLPFVNLPLLKILHLYRVIFLNNQDCLRLFSKIPNIEELEVTTDYLVGLKVTTDYLAMKPTDVMTGKFNRLPKLIRAKIHGDLVPLKIVKDVEVLVVDEIIYQRDLIFDFQNLVKLELEISSNEQFVKVLKVLNHCPKLQTLVIDIYKDRFDSSDDEDRFDLSDDEEPVWSYPQFAPTCISLHLTSFFLKNSGGSTEEFQFTSYIMRNAKYLRVMKIDTADAEKLEKMSKPSSWIKRSYFRRLKKRNK